ncbi:DeoR/GlpR family DNA-binding transcription regulator [Cohnella sp. WQ 127256]|uniref:DeoR/GlpR family DNA-binding transcription regulator n=1 Tax=Cohnella sp. WQ 127256 TaxID=2938790 RepID=UPI0021172E1F|nr:DeoR/GlpR family DNA-binding transcription regulator [Cohnella sp. WQ 127256]
MLHSFERLFSIQKTIDEQGVVRVSELSNRFKVTEATIRSDLAKLEIDGKIIRRHGGAASLTFSNHEPPAIVTYTDNNQSRSEEQLTPYPHRINMYKKEKMQIAKEALAMLQPHDRIILDASSTSFYLAKIIPMDLPITVLTNSVNVIIELNKKEKTEVISTGGILSKNSMSFIGPVSEGTLGMYNVNKAFLSCKGLHFKSGITESSELQVLVKRKMMEVSEQVIFLADHSKFGLKDFAYLATFNQVDTIITDSEVEPQHREAMDKAGIHYLIAE